MPTQSQLRKRRKSQQSTALDSQPAPKPQPSRTRQLSEKLKPVLLTSLQVAVSIGVGLTAAASFSNIFYGILLLIMTVIAVVVSLIRTTMSIIRQSDQTPVYMPDVHNPDGTIVPQKQMTVKEHDDKVVAYFSRELLAMGIATVWFYMWSLFKPTFAIYMAYIAFRLLFHPLFRIHLWHESSSPDLGRPFGAVPLFDKGASAVKTIEGDAQFQQALQTAKKGTLVVLDCSATWCAPCKQMAPVFEKLAEEFIGHSFITIDVDISRDVATNLAVSSVPSFVIFKDGQRMEMLRGPSSEKLREAIRSHV